MAESPRQEASGNTYESHKEVSLITCTNAKRESKAAAKNLYDPSGYFCDMRSWAEARNKPWYILSAKHGLVHPETKLEPYDSVGLSEAQANKIAKALANRDTKTVHITGGSDYTNVLTPELEARGIEVIEVCRGLKIGERRSWLQTRVNELVNGTLNV